MHRVVVRHDLRTVGDYLERRYSQSVRLVIAGLLWVGALFILSGQLIALAWILGVVAGIPKLAGCVIGGVVVTTYFAAGGLVTSARVNMVQLTVKLVGLGLALPFALAAAGGWSSVSALHPRPDYWSFMQGGSSGWMYLAMLGPAFVASPGLLQKVYGARDIGTVRLGVGMNALGLFLYAGVPVLLGMIARVMFPDLTAPDLALPTILVHGVPPAIGILGLAAVVSAELSAADAVLFMLTTSLSQDLYKRFLVKESDDRQLPGGEPVDRGDCRRYRHHAGGVRSIGDRGPDHFLHLDGSGALRAPAGRPFHPPRVNRRRPCVDRRRRGHRSRDDGRRLPGPVWMTPALCGLVAAVIAMGVSLTLSDRRLSKRV